MKKIIGLSTIFSSLLAFSTFCLPELPGPISTPLVYLNKQFMEKYAYPMSIRPYRKHIPTIGFSCDILAGSYLLNKSRNNYGLMNFVSDVVDPTGPGTKNIIRNISRSSLFAYIGLYSIFSGFLGLKAQRSQK